MLKCLCWAHRETIWLCPSVHGCRKEVNTSSPVLQKKWPFYFTSSPPLPLCTIKQTGIQTLKRWFFGDTTLPSSQSAGFLNKVIFLALTPVSRFTGLSCGEQSELGLSNIHLRLINLRSLIWGGCERCVPAAGFPGNWQSTWCQFPLQMVASVSPWMAKIAAMSCLLSARYSGMSLQDLLLQTCKHPFPVNQWCLGCLLTLEVGQQDVQVSRMQSNTTSEHLHRELQPHTTSFSWAWWTHWLLFLVPVRTRCCSFWDLSVMANLCIFSYCSRETCMSNSSTLTTLLLLLLLLSRFSRVRLCATP